MSRNKAKRFPLPPAAQGAAGPYNPHGGIITFAGRPVDPAGWDGMWRNATSWLDTGSSLLRAGRVVRLQAITDQNQTNLSVQKHSTPRAVATLPNQFVMLAAMALENAIKAVLVIRSAAVTAPTGRIPKSVGKHSLAALAKDATFDAKNAREEDVLRHGEDVIRWLGRYPTTLHADEMPSGWSLDPIGFFDACETMFHRAVEIVGRDVHARGGAYIADEQEWIARFCSQYQERVAI